MCNEAYRRTQLGEIAQDWGQTRIPLVFPEGRPNMAPLESIRITDRIEIIRAATSEDDAPVAEMVTRRWSWPGAGGRPVYNYRSDGRSLTHGRCLIPVEGFFEFTTPKGAAKRAPKSKWAFEMAGRPWFCIAGLWRTDADVGQAWTMLTCPPGPDIAPYHSRQVVVLGPDQWAAWLDPAVPSDALCRPSPAGTLTIRQVR